jgi:hypothetical protein
MKRIDSVNARPDENGQGKAGFHDNADLSGQDATYVTPDWFNTVQEELCNLLELNGIVLNPTSKRQLYDLLTTQADLEALADAIETNFIRKSQIIDNLTTNDATKPVSAAQAKNLQDNKLEKDDLKDASTDQKGIVQLNNTLTSTSTTEAATANTVKLLNDRFTNDFLNLKSENGYQKLPSGLIIQWGRFTPTMATTVGSPQYVSYPIAFPNKLLFAVPSTNGGATSGTELAHIDTSLSTKTQLGIYTNYNNSDCWYFAVGY